MTLLKILNYPDIRLKNVAKKVINVKEKRVQQMLDDMIDTLKNTPKCGGLASTQLDIIDPYRIFVFYEIQEDNISTINYIINPEIVEVIGSIYEKEGCMSVYPDYIQAKVKRPTKTTIKGINREGTIITMTRHDYLAKLFIHETDHLNGKLYIDHLSSVKRNLIEIKITKARKLLQKKQQA